MARRLAPDVRRRPRLRLQVEHGLDARHARLLPAATRSTAASTTTTLTFVAALRVHRELHPAALARRGRARQGLAAREDAGRPLAEAREPARALRATCGRIPGKKLLFMGGELGAGAGVEPRAARSTGTCSATPEHAGVQRARARPQPRLPRTSRRCGSSTSTRPASAGSRRTTPPTTSSRSRGSRRRRRAPLVCVCNFSPVPRHGYRVGLPVGGRWRELLNTDAASTAAAAAATLGGVEARRCRGTTQPLLGDADAAAARASSGSCRE